MPLSLVSEGEVVAELGASISRDPDQLTCAVRPTAAFERIRPVIDAFADSFEQTMSGMNDAVGGIADPDARAGAAGAWLKSDDGFQRRMADFERLVGLNLTVADETGATLPFGNVLVNRLPLMPDDPTMREHFQAAGFAGAPPFYIVGATRLSMPPAHEQG